MAKIPKQEKNRRRRETSMGLRPIKRRVYHIRCSCGHTKGHKISNKYGGGYECIHCGAKIR